MGRLHTFQRIFRDSENLGHSYIITKKKKKKNLSDYKNKRNYNYKKIPFFFEQHKDTFHSLKINR